MLMVDSLARPAGSRSSRRSSRQRSQDQGRCSASRPKGRRTTPDACRANSAIRLVVLGAENRAIHYRLFFGYDNEKLVEESRITVVLIVPKVQAA